MKKLLILLLALLCLTACAEEVDYTQVILGEWYAVEYEGQFVNFRSDGVVENHRKSGKIRGHYKVDNENALLWINFGDDIYSVRISEEDGKIILLDNNGTLVRQEDLAAARSRWEESKNNNINKNNSY